MNAANTQTFQTPYSVKNELLSGITVALALVPEAVAFSFVAGVSPTVGLYAAFFVGLITACIGGRPGMISGATGAMAVVMTAFVTLYGIEYLFGAVILAGAFQVLAGIFKLGKFIRFLPHSVMIGFVNGLAIVIGLAQLKQLKINPSIEFNSEKLLFFIKTDWPSFFDVKFLSFLGLIALTLFIIYTLPKITKALPGALVAIIVVTLLSENSIVATTTVKDSLVSQKELAKEKNIKQEKFNINQR